VDSHRADDAGSGVPDLLGRTASLFVNDSDVRNEALIYASLELTAYHLSTAKDGGAGGNMRLVPLSHIKK
jgi:hypothetical protein